MSWILVVWIALTPAYKTVTVYRYNFVTRGDCAAEGDDALAGKGEFSTWNVVAYTCQQGRALPVN